MMQKLVLFLLLAVIIYSRGAIADMDSAGDEVVAATEGFKVSNESETVYIGEPIDFTVGINWYYWVLDPYMLPFWGIADLLDGLDEDKYKLYSLGGDFHPFIWKANEDFVKKIDSVYELNDIFENHYSYLRASYESLKLNTRKNGDSFDFPEQYDEAFFEDNVLLVIDTTVRADTTITVECICVKDDILVIRTLRVWRLAPGDAYDFKTFFIELSRADIVGVEEIEIYIRWFEDFSILLPEPAPLPEPSF